MAAELKERKEVDKALTWDLTALFKTEEQYDTAVKEVRELAGRLESEYKGKLDSPDRINACLDRLRDMDQRAETAYCFANLAVATDHGNAENQARFIKFSNVAADVDSRLSFIRSEILQADEKVIKLAMEESADNRNMLKEILRYKRHTLHPEAERVLSALSSTLDSPEQIYSAAKLADMDFKPFTSDGREYPLSFVLYEENWAYEKDTNIRRAAFKAFSSKLREYKNTIASAYQTQVQKEKTLASLRGFESVTDSLLFPQQVDMALYFRQIDVITEKLAPHMRKYAKLLQRIHKLDEMTYADLKLAVDPDYNPELSAGDSIKYVEGALSVMGEDYLSVVKRAYGERWIDFAQNKGKSTGAFCASPYGSHPFILLSWAGQMTDVFTLVHELGHAGHFCLAHRNQNIFDSRPSRYFIEAPSTMNELLLGNYLMKSTNDLRFKRWVLSSMVQNTYYHNFVTHLLEAAYQREVYKVIDGGGSVQADQLSGITKNVLERFWGDAVKIVEGAELTWMRQPHYYYGLYPYTYSAGLTIATEVSKRILSEGQPAVDDWREVLEAGGTKTPVELAKMAKVDITTDKPLIDTIGHIGKMIDEIIELTDRIESANFARLPH